MGFEPNTNKRLGRGGIIAAIIVGAVIAVILFFVAYHAFLNSDFINQKSPVYRFAYNYGDTGEYTVPSDYNYSDDSPEGYFRDGLYAYAVEEDVDSALELFKKAEDRLDSRSDDALPFYLYCYLNRCAVKNDGIGDKGYVEKAVDASFNYPPTVNDHYHFWQVIYSIAEDEETNAIAKDYLERALALGDGLSDEARIRYNNYIAMLDFFDGNYSKSLRRFYDVRKMYKDIKNPSDVIKDQRFFTNSYIGILFYEFGDFDSAIEILKANINSDDADTAVSADNKYSDYINLSNAYIENGDGKNAIAALDEMQVIIPDISDDIRESVAAVACGNYAWAYTLEGQLDKAKKYIDEGRKHLELMESDAFYGGPLFIDLAQARLYMAQGEYHKAIELLEGIQDSGEMEYSGLEEDVYKLLIDSYDAVGRREDYYDTKDKLRLYDDEFYQTIKREYLEFSEYYETSEMLSEENQILRVQNMATEIIVGIIILALLLAIIIIIAVRYNSLIDSLTGVKNRKALSIFSKKHSVTGVPAGTCFMMLDIDYFKKYNDTYGHLMGDEALKKVAGTIKGSLRKNDLIIRYGGEEFLIILKNVDEFSAREIANHILVNVEAVGIKTKTSPISNVVTVSLGLCLCAGDGVDVDDLITEADAALYKAKELGRNCMCIHSRGN